MKHKSSLMLAAGFLFITAAAFITGYNVAEDRYAEEASSEVINLGRCFREGHSRLSAEPQYGNADG